jgi:hypothetical protein
MSNERGLSVMALSDFSEGGSKVVVVEKSERQEVFELLLDGAARRTLHV